MKRIHRLLRSLFPFLYKVHWHLKPQHQTKLAFTSLGIEYHQMMSGWDSYYERYMAALDRLEEIELKVDKKYLDTHQQLMTEYLKKGDIYNASVINENLKQRRQYIFNVELLYNLASVWFFDKKENVYTYNYDYADEKIKRWKKDKNLLAFFLQTPLMKYIPPFDMSQESMLRYIKGQQLNDLIALKNQLLTISETSENKELIANLSLQLKEIEELAGAI